MCFQPLRNKNEVQKLEKLWPFREGSNFKPGGCVCMCACACRRSPARLGSQYQANGEPEPVDREWHDAPLCLLLAKRHVNGRDMRGCAQG